MNEELYLIFHELNPASSVAIGHSFKEAPKMILLIEFLKSANTNFKSTKAINYIYQSEIKTVPYSKLVNRFYKLRQQLMEWLYLYLKKTDDNSTKEEQTLSFVRYLYRNNQYKDAFERALVLEKHCLSLNLFELLPEILNIIVETRMYLFEETAGDAFNDGERLLECINLEQAWRKMQYYYNQSYYDVLLEDYQKMLANLRKVVAPYKHFPRFEIMYHFIAFGRGCTVLGYLLKSNNVLMRHLNKLNQLMQRYPDIPLAFLEAQHKKRTLHRLLMLKNIFYFYRNQPTKLRQTLHERAILEKNNPSIKFQESESTWRTLQFFYIVVGQFAKAQICIQKLQDFHKNQEQEDRTDIILSDSARLAFFQFPDKKALSMSQILLEQLNKKKTDPRFEATIAVARILLHLQTATVIVEKTIKTATPILNKFGVNPGLLMRLSTAIFESNAPALKDIMNQMNVILEDKINLLKIVYYKQLLVLTAFHLTNSKIYQ